MLLMPWWPSKSRMQLIIDPDECPSMSFMMVGIGRLSTIANAPPIIWFQIAFADRGTFVLQI